jgi:hypothetical protein
MQEILPAQGMQWSEDVLCGETERLGCHMLASWQYGYLERWIVITDLGFNKAQLAWYGMRFWIETSYKQQKSGGWQWQVTQMSEPQRASRMWLVMSVSSLWAISAGAQLEVEEQERQERKEEQEKLETHAMCLSTVPAAFSAFSAFPQPVPAESGRQASGASGATGATGATGQAVKKAVATQSCFTRGRAFLWAKLFRQEPWTPSCLPAEAWPSEPPPPRFVLTPRQQQEQQQQIARRIRNRKAEQRKERNRKAKQEQAALTNMS